MREKKKVACIACCVFPSTLVSVCLYAKKRSLKKPRAHTEGGWGAGKEGRGGSVLSMSAGAGAAKGGGGPMSSDDGARGAQTSGGGGSESVELLASLGHEPAAEAALCVAFIMTAPSWSSADGGATSTFSASTLARTAATMLSTVVVFWR